MNHMLYIIYKKRKNAVETSDNTFSHQDVSVLFDGSLLNRTELSKLLATPMSDTVSDAELAARIFGQYGSKSFCRLKGFWSLIAIDRCKNIVYAARDAFGCHQLYYCHTAKQFALANDSRTLYNLFDDTRHIDHNNVIDYLLWGNIGKRDQYFYRDIHSIEPATFIAYDIKNDTLTTERYYAMPYNTAMEKFTVTAADGYVKQIRNAVASTVKINIETLVNKPLAFGVSGGMDSSALICMTKQLYPDRTLVAYTTTDQYEGGEVDWAEKVVRHTKAEWVKVVCTPKMIAERLGEANMAHNIPIYNASSLVQYLMMEKVAKHGQKIFIDGQGGDELFGGYPEYFPIWLRQLRRNRNIASWFHELKAVGNSGQTIQEMLLRRFKLIAKKWYYTPYRLAAKSRPLNLQSLNARKVAAYFASEPPFVAGHQDALNDALFESYTTFLGNILRWSEQSSRTHGITCVMPFADNTDLAEKVFAIPSTFKIHNGWNKYLLRQAMVGIVPNEICWRRQKMGFYIPEQRWLNALGNEMLHTIRTLDDPEDCINKKHIQDIWKTSFLPKNTLFQQFIFRCYSYLLWRNGAISSNTT